MKRYLSTDDVLTLMRTRMNGRRAKDYAKELGISPAYLSDILLRKRGVTGELASKLGLLKRELFERISR